MKKQLITTTKVGKTPSFNDWVKEFRVSSSYVKPTMYYPNQVAPKKTFKLFNFLFKI